MKTDYKIENLPTFSDFRNKSLKAKVGPIRLTVPLLAAKSKL